MSRSALSAVLRSLSLAELRTARGRDSAPPAAAGQPTWPDDLPIGGGGLGCDSLDRLSLAAAANEMFHLHEAETESDLLAARYFGDWLDAIAGAWRDGVATITVTTSGSTGLPKRCPHAAAHLRAEIDTLAARWAGRRRIVALVPAHHIYGLLFTALLPDRLGIPVLYADGLGAGRFADKLRGGDLVVSFPDRWAYLLRSLPAWPADVLGVTSTAPCPPDLATDLKAAGLAGFTEVYGSSETGGIGMRDAPDLPYRMMPHWRFADPFDGDAPALIERHSGDVFTLSDRVGRVGPDGFVLHGRRDGVVQVGGVNVSPTAIGERLRARPGVRDAAVRLMRPAEGSRLKAYLVPEPGSDPEAVAAAVEAWAAVSLSAAERPTAITLGPAIPTAAFGKAADW